MHCTNCGTEVAAGAAFCGHCGKPIAATAPVASQSAQPGLQPNVAGLLCYLAGFITGVLFLVIEPYKNDRFVRFHAFQSIFLSIAWIVVHFGLGIFLTMLPLALWAAVTALSSLVSLAFLLMILFLMYKAYVNEKFKLPVIGDLAERQA
jgi:uncharacterized membrane protein